MTDIPDNLVNQIAQRVLEAMGRSGGKPAGVAPRQAMIGGQTLPHVAADGELAHVVAGGNGCPARVWLTAEVFAARADGRPAVVLGPNEFLTPAARDYADAHGIELRRGGGEYPVPSAQHPVAGSQAPAASSQCSVASATKLTTAAGPDFASRLPVAGSRLPLSPSALVGTLGLVVHRPDRKVEAALATIVRDGVLTAGFGDSDCPMCNTGQMCKAVVAGQLAGGIVIDRYAAGAMVYTAKIDGIRPVQAVSAAAVKAALRQFDANVVVIGHADLSVYEIRSAIAHFAAGRRAGHGKTALTEAIEKLEKK
jgi:ribose 5-phosphate isomerase RpiB